MLLNCDLVRPQTGQKLARKAQVGSPLQCLYGSDAIIYLYDRAIGLLLRSVLRVVNWDARKQ